MIGVYGYNTKNNTYWYKVTMMNSEVETGKNLTRKQMDEVKERISIIWNRDYDSMF
jgi:hypothetical protein